MVTKLYIVNGSSWIQPYLTMSKLVLPITGPTSLAQTLCDGGKPAKHTFSNHQLYMFCCFFGEYHICRILDLSNVTSIV